MGVVYNFCVHFVRDYNSTPILQNVCIRPCYVCVLNSQWLMSVHIPYPPESKSPSKKNALPSLAIKFLRTVPAIKTLPFSFRFDPSHTTGTDTHTFRTVYFHSYHFICTRNSCACAMRVCKLVKFWLHVCGFLWGLPNYLWLQVTAKRKHSLSNGDQHGYASGTFSTIG